MTTAVASDSCLDAQRCKLSVVIIAKNEALNLSRCLTSVAFADEIIVVENGSEDDTAAIAVRHGAAVVSTSDWPGFGVQKNRGLALAHGHWVLSLDADEVVTAELRTEIQSAIVLDNSSTFNLFDKPSFECYEIPRTTQFRGQWIRHCGWTPDYVLRLFKSGSAKFTDDLVHEKLIPIKAFTPVGKLKSPLMHFSYAQTNQFWQKTQRYSQDWAKQRYAQGKVATVPRAILAAAVAFIRSYILKLGFLDGSMGFAVCWMQAQAAFGKYFELYCLNLQDQTSRTGIKNEKA